MPNPIQNLLSKHVLKAKRVRLKKKFRVDADFSLPNKALFEKTLQMNGGKALFDGNDYGVKEVQKLLKVTSTEALLVMMIGGKLGCWK